SLVALHHGSGTDHLAHVEGGAEPAAQGAEGSVGHARHRGEHDGRIGPEVADLQWREGGGRCDGASLLAAGPRSNRGRLRPTRQWDTIGTSPGGMAGSSAVILV